MFKKTIVFSLILVFLLAFFVFPVFAADTSNNYTYDYKEFVISEGFEGENTLYKIKTPPTFWVWNCVDELQNGKVVKSVENTSFFEVNRSDVKWHDGGGSLFNALYRPFGRRYLSLSNIPNGSSIRLNLKMTIKNNPNDDFYWYNHMTIRYYDKNFKIVGKDYQFSDNKWYWTDNTTSPANTEHGEHGNGGTATMETSVTATISKPLNAEYISIFFYAEMGLGFYTNDPNAYVWFILSDEPTMDILISTDYLQTITNDKISNQIDSVQQDVQALPGQIGNEFQGIIEQENEAANQAGNSSTGQLAGVMPDESQGFINAIRNLASSMSYNGTSAVLPIPSIVLPSISGVMEETKLTEELSVDFGYWVQKIPDNVLQLVKILGTIALIVFCFKELYSCISYALTLKGGGADE